MLARRLSPQLRGITSSTNLVRSFLTTPASRDSHELPRSPSLADVTPNGAAAFDAKQKKFRAETKGALKSQEQQDSQSLNASSSFSDYLRSSSSTVTSAVSKIATPTAQSASNAGHDHHSPMALGTFSTSKTEAEKSGVSADEPNKKKGALSSLIYGTKEGQQMDQEIEKSFSQVLARGKYVHSIVFHQVKPKKVDEYVDLVGKWYPKMASMPENKVNLVGSWRTEVGDCDTFVHIWEYQRYHGYHSSLHSIASHPEFPEFDHKLKKLIFSKNTSLMQEFSFWPTTAPRKLGGVFELRSYTLHPGNLLEWETHWRRGLAARREVMEGVGAWFVQIGELNTVHHLWQFADLEERKLRRERSWGVEGWGETVHKTVPLIQSMKSRVLVPMPWSPVA